MDLHSGLQLFLSIRLYYIPGLRGVGGGGREGLGGLEGLKLPFESDGELFSLTLLSPPDPASSGSPDPLFTLENN